MRLAVLPKKCQMTKKPAHPPEIIATAVAALAVLGSAIREATTVDETAPDEHKAQAEIAQRLALSHLGSIASALTMATAMDHILGHVNKPALQEAVAAYHQCQQSTEQVH